MTGLQPLRGFTLGCEIAAIILWVVMVYKTQAIVGLVGQVEKPGRARAIIWSLEALILLQVALYITGSVISAVNRTPITLASWVPVCSSVACVSVALSALLVLRYTKPNRRRVTP